MRGKNTNCRSCRRLKWKVEAQEREIQKLYEQKLEFHWLEQKIERELQKLQHK